MKKLVAQCEEARGMQAADRQQEPLSQPMQLQHLLGPPMGLANPLTQLLMLGSLVSQPLLNGLSPAALSGMPSKAHAVMVWNGCTDAGYCSIDLLQLLAVFNHVVRCQGQSALELTV